MTSSLEGNVEIVLERTNVVDLGLNLLSTPYYEQ